VCFRTVPARWERKPTVSVSDRSRPRLVLALVALVVLLAVGMVAVVVGDHGGAPVPGFTVPHGDIVSRAQLVAPAGAPCGPGAAVTTRPDVALDELFQTYGDAGTGRTWTGGDGTESVSVPGGRELWLFDDSLLGSVSDGRRDFSTAPFLHNSLVVERRGVLTTTYYTLPTARNRPTAYINAVPRYRYKYAFWPVAAVVDGATVQVLGNERYFYKNGTQSGVPGAYVETLGLPSLDRLGLRELPLATAGDDYIGGTLSAGGYTYIYLESGTGDVYAARVPGTDLAAPWTYDDGSGWSAHATGAVPVERLGFENHVSVSAVGHAYVFIARSEAFTNQIVAALGCSPVGPFGPSQEIYATPEQSEYPAGDKIVTYGAHAHPELTSSPGTLVVSYDVNFAAVDGLVNPDASVYRPRFIEVTVDPRT